MSQQSLVFDKALREVTAPQFGAYGFVFDGSRTFRRISENGDRVDIVNFQLGQRWLEGKFTVNLGIFHKGDNIEIDVMAAKEHDCPFDRRSRIGLVIPPWNGVLVNLPFIGFLFGGQDRWWKFSIEPARTISTVEEVTDLVVKHGFNWFTKKGSE